MNTNPPNNGVCNYKGNSYNYKSSKTKLTALLTIEKTSSSERNKNKHSHTRTKPIDNQQNITENPVGTMIFAKQPKTQKDKPASPVKHATTDGKSEQAQGTLN